MLVDCHLLDFSNSLAKSSIGKIAKFLLCLHPIPISSPPSQLLLLPSVYMFTGYLPFLFPLHHLSSPVRVVSSPWADLFMSNGCASCFPPLFLRPTPCLQQTGSLTAGRENRVELLDGWMHWWEWWWWWWWVGAVIWPSRPYRYHQACRETAPLHPWSHIAPVVDRTPQMVQLCIQIPLNVQ